MIRAVPFDDAAALTSAMVAELAVRYEDDDSASPADASDFAEPPAVFLVVARDGEDVACGGLRLLAPGVGELKRMYVAPSARGHGTGSELLRALLSHARSAGLQSVWLETGTRQPEAVGLYESEGFAPIPPYGHFKDHIETRCYALEL